MFHRLGAAFIAVMFALGLFAGLGSTYAAAAPGSVGCHNLLADQAAAEHPSPVQDCGHDAGHMTCCVHVSCVAFVLPALPVIRGHIGSLDWHPMPLSGLYGASLSPEIRPPIATL